MSPQTENEAEPILNKNKFQKCQLPYPVRLCSWTYDYTAIGLRKILNLSTRPVLSTFWYEDVSVTTSFFSTFINKHFLNDHRVSGTMLSSEVQCQASPPAPHSTQMPPFKISSPLLNPFRILFQFLWQHDLLIFCRVSLRDIFAESSGFPTNHILPFSHSFV